MWECAYGCNNNRRRIIDSAFTSCSNVNVQFAVQTAATLAARGCPDPQVEEKYANLGCDFEPVLNMPCENKIKFMATDTIVFALMAMPLVILHTVALSV